MDAWMLRRTGALVRQCREWYENFEFHRAYHAIHDFCAVDLSAFYFDVLKDRLYTFAPQQSSGGARRKRPSIASPSALVRLIAPMLVFTAEEVWKYLPRGAARSRKRAHGAVSRSPERLGAPLTSRPRKNGSGLLAVREEVLKSLEPARAEKLISLRPRSARDALPPIRDLAQPAARSTAKCFRALFIVSQVRSEQTLMLAGRPGIARLQIARGRRARSASAAGIIRRTWAKAPNIPTVCERCVAALDEIERRPRTGGS